MSGRTIELVVVGAMLAGTLVAETHKDFRFNVGPKAGVSVNNPYGSISVKPSTGNVVVVNAVLASDKVEVDNNLVGNRVDIQSHLLPGADAQSGRVDYEILVPADASITLHSTTGPLRAEKLHGDVTLEGSAASVEIRDISRRPCSCEDSEWSCHSHQRAGWPCRNRLPERCSHSQRRHRAPGTGDLHHRRALTTSATSATTATTASPAIAATLKPPCPTPLRPT